MEDYETTESSRKMPLSEFKLVLLTLPVKVLAKGLIDELLEKERAQDFIKANGLFSKYQKFKSANV